MEHLTAAQASARRGGLGRLLGIDAARALALIGMMAVHILPASTATGEAAWYYIIAGGRSSALFAVLAGLGLALASGGVTPREGPELRAARRGTAARALVLGAIGLILGSLDSGVAVILVHYGFLFVIGALWLGLSARPLLILAFVWSLAAPVVSHLLRSGGQPGPQVPGIDLLLQPITLVGDVFLTGYYPVFTWVSYLLVGLGVGRLTLRHRTVAWRLLGAGLAVALSARLASGWILARPGGVEQVSPLPVQFFGTTPTDSWWYLAVATPHSGSTFDLLHTGGSALATIGLCLLVASFSAAAVAWLAGAGGMSLTLYSAHVVALLTRLGFEHRLRLLAIHIVTALVVGLGWRTMVGRGPLETLAANVAAVAKATVVVNPKAR